MGTTGTSNDQIVYTLYGPKIVTNPQASFGTPPPGAPIFRRMKPGDEPPSITSANRIETTRRAARATSSHPYARPKIPAIHVPSRPLVPRLTSPSVFTTLDNTLRGCMERIQAEVNCIGAAWRGSIYRVHREAQRWKSQCEAAERERDVVRERLRALTLELNAKNPPNPPSVPENETTKTFSKIGPVRSYSLSPPTRCRRASQSPTSEHCPNPRPRSAEPYLPSRSADDCFDVTIIGCNPASSHSASNIRTPGPQLIRDALNPDAPPRLCPTPTGPGEIGIHHIDIMYIPRGGELFCRACATDQEQKKGNSVKTFPNNALWNDLRDHCLKEHPDACRDIAKLTPAQIYDLRRRLQAIQPSP